MASMKELPETPSSKSICYMAAAMLDMEVTIDNRHPFWSMAVELSEKAYKGLYNSIEDRVQNEKPAVGNPTIKWIWMTEWCQQRKLSPWNNDTWQAALPDVVNNWRKHD